MATAPHDPVMVDRIVELLAVPDDRPAVLVDCTLGAGGHAAALLAASGSGTHLVGFDRDPDALELAGRRLVAHADRITLVHAPFDEFTEHVSPVVDRHGPLLGVLYDLGVSSMQLDTPGRGFSFRAFGPLDMRMDPTSPLTAAELVNSASLAELERILREYGEEPHARRVAEAIVSHRPLTTTMVLADLVAQALPRGARRKDRAKGIHPATRTFQALRIAVNEEVDGLRSLIEDAVSLLRAGGRLAAISFHSLEDRAVKHALRSLAERCSCPPGMPVCGCGKRNLVRILTPKPVRPTPAEVEHNPRARSAKLRATERI